MSIPEKNLVSVLVKCARHCSICRRFLPLQVQVHHIIEKSQGGSDEEENLLPVCISCHSMIHVKTHMTKNFSIKELKAHRDEVYDMVSSGKLPAQAQITTGEMHAISTIIAETLKSQSQDTKLSEDSIKLLLAAACEDTYIEILKTEKHFCLIIGEQEFTIGGALNSQYPEAIFELAQKGYIILDNNLGKLTDLGISQVQELVKVTERYFHKKIKCLKCSLHFSIYSWHSELHRAKDIHCPECGQSEGAFIIWRQSEFGFIFNQVPGNANLLEVGHV